MYLCSWNEERHVPSDCECSRSFKQLAAVISGPFAFNLHATTAQSLSFDLLLFFFLFFPQGYTVELDR